MTATATTVMQTAQASPFSRLRLAMNAWIVRRAERRAVAELASLDARTLKDMGLSRSEIFSVVAGDHRGR